MSKKPCLYPFDDCICGEPVGIMVLHQDRQRELNKHYSRLLDTLAAQVMRDESMDWEEQPPAPLTLEDAKERIGPWSKKDKDALYAYLNRVWGCRMP